MVTTRRNGERTTIDTSTRTSPPAAARESVLLDMLPHISRTFRREPALAITLGYLLVAMAGIFYDYSFYAKFGIPVLSLSQISDFLVAGIQQPMALLIVLLMFPLVWLFDWVNSRSRRRRSKKLEQLRTSPPSDVFSQRKLKYLTWRMQHRWPLQLMYLSVIAVYGWMFVRLYADYRADAVRAGNALQVTVWLNGDANSLATSAKTWTYLGAVSNYVFVYDQGAKRSAILPVNNITRIEPADSQPAAKSGVTVVPIP